MENKKRIAVVMWYDENIKEYGDVNYLINKTYCKKHGYDIIHSSVRNYAETDRTPHWERIPLLLKFLHKYDYLVWIDADAHFYIDSPGIEIVINKYPTKSLILSGDYPHFHPQEYEINSGFFIVKNDKFSYNILNAWAYSEKLKKLANINNARYGDYNDQQVLRLMYDRNILNTKFVSVVVPYGRLQHFQANDQTELLNKPFIFHLAGSSSSVRIEHSINYYLENIIKLS